MFRSGDAQNLAAETRPPQIFMEFATNGGGGGGGAGLQVPVSIPGVYNVYPNGNNIDPNAADSPPPQENCLNPPNPNSNPNSNPQNPVYRECQRNHAANMGGHAVDGCGEFMADEEEALKCAVCGCHRNFHRRETGEESPPPCEFCRRKRHFGAAASGSPSQSPLLSYYTPPLGHGSISPHLLGDSDDPDCNNNNNSNYSQRGGSRKRFRTKFSQEQKEKMCMFAERVGWRMQKQDEVAVQQFCSEIGVEKGVLKVWMHNNKNTLGKKP